MFLCGPTPRRAITANDKMQTNCVDYIVPEFRCDVRTAAAHRVGKVAEYLLSATFEEPAGHFSLMKALVRLSLSWPLVKN